MKILKYIVIYAGKEGNVGSVSESSTTKDADENPRMPFVKTLLLWNVFRDGDVLYNYYTGQ